MALETEIRDLREVIANTKTSLVTNIIATKQNSRKLDYLAKNKNTSKEAVGMIEVRKKHEQQEFKYSEAVTATGNLTATLQEQLEKKAFLHQKIQKWAQRCELYDKPFQDKAKVKALNEKIKTLKDLLAKDEVAKSQLGKSPSVHDDAEEFLRSGVQVAGADGRDDEPGGRPARAPVGPHQWRDCQARFGAEGE